MDNPPEIQTVGAADCAAMLGVSAATVRNWVRTGVISPLRLRPLAFSAAIVREFSERLKSGEANRLNHRANKHMATGDAPLPRESISGNTTRLLRSVVERWSQTDAASPVDAMRTAFLQLLHDRGELRCDGVCRRRAVAQCIAGWDLQWYQAGIFDGFAIAPELPALLYQIQLGSGVKARSGVFYTPPQLAEETVARLRGTTELLDPCCGGGAFLLAARRKLKLDLDHLYGIDRDPAAVEITKLTLLLDAPESDTLPHIIAADALIEGGFNRRFAALAVNPPWCGGDFAEFIAAALDRWLTPGGRAAFLLPEAVTTVHAHAPIRRRLLEETTLEKLTPLGRRWNGVLSNAVRIEFCNTPPAYPSSQQKRFAANRDFRFDLRVSDYDADLLRKIFAIPHQTLAGHARWALGIVTGNNQKLLHYAPVSGSEPVLRGPDIHPFYITTPSRHIVFEPAVFQQCAPESMYRAPQKLLYKFISKRLVIALDDRKRLHLNSVNAMIPELSGLSCEAVMAVLNSSVFQYIHQKCDATCKVLRRDLENLPFPLELPDAQLARDGSTEAADEIVFAAFHLTPAEIAHIRRELDN